MKEYARKFYLSKMWQNARNAYFKSKCGLCERCGAVGEIVHHRKYITPRNIHDANITLNWANLELLCRDCHNKEHTKKQSARYRIDENGKVLPPVPRK